jgi:hypothetical protein
MSTSESMRALRAENPRTKTGITQSLAAAADAVHARLLDSEAPTASARRGPSRRPLVRLSAVGAALGATAAAAALLTVVSPTGGPGVEDAAAAVRRAATLTAAAASQSGTVTVRITRGGELWAAKTIRWHDEDLFVSRDAPSWPGRPGSELLVVEGILYGVDPADGQWVVLGDPASIDPDSGTTPDEYLAAVHEDIGGMTLRRITGGMTGLTQHRLDDGSVVYRGRVAAWLVAPESGFKEGEPIRVLPWGYVAHDQAADPAALLDAAITVEPDGIFSEIAVTWGAGASALIYTVTYQRLGATPALVAPEGARPLKRRAPG